MVELLYLSVLDDGERFEFVSLETLAYPLDFQASINELQCEHERIAHNEALNWTEVFGFFGPVEEVALFEDDILGEVYGFRMFPEFNYERRGDDEAFIQTACIELLKEQTQESMAGSYRLSDEEVGFALVLVATSESFPSLSHCIVALEQYAKAWMHQEQPTPLG